jgi:hypothetical protein
MTMSKRGASDGNGDGLGSDEHSDEHKQAANGPADASDVVLNRPLCCSADLGDGDSRFGRHPPVHLEDTGAVAPNCGLSCDLAMPVGLRG